MFGSLLFGDVSSSSVYPGGHETRLGSRANTVIRTANAVVILRTGSFRLTPAQTLQQLLILRH